MVSDYLRMAGEVEFRLDWIAWDKHHHVRRDFRRESDGAKEGVDG